MKATRHNGRAGKHGVYDAKHNDRRFDVENSEHIDAERTKLNVYWDCYQGYTLPNDENKKAEFTFTQVEKAYYFDHYSEHCDAQNERNKKARHYDRVKTTDGLLENSKTCPEETLLQLGNIDGSVEASVLAQVSAEYFEEFNKRYGSHVHILDWALHLDESTPHIHERHVFDAVNQYGELCPQQDKALEELGMELPDPTKKKGKYNNRKMTFDDECRKLFISICQKHGLEIDIEPVYGGVSYLEKQDYIIQNQKKRIEELESKLDGLVIKIEDVETVVDEAVDLAYEKAVEVVTDQVKEETIKHDLDEVKDYGKWLAKSKNTDEVKRIGGNIVGAVIKRLENASKKFLNRLIEKLQEPMVKEKAKEQIKSQARISIREQLARNQKLVEEARTQKQPTTRKQNMEI